MKELVAEWEFCPQAPALTGESKRELQLHEGNVVLSGVCGVRLKDEDFGHRQGWGAAQSV